MIPGSKADIIDSDWIVVASDRTVPPLLRGQIGHVLEQTVDELGRPAYTVNVQLGLRDPVWATLHPEQILVPEPDEQARLALAASFPADTPIGNVLSNFVVAWFLFLGTVRSLSGLRDDVNQEQKLFLQKSACDVLTLYGLKPEDLDEQAQSHLIGHWGRASTTAATLAIYIRNALLRG